MDWCLYDKDILYERANDIFPLIKYALGNLFLKNIFTKKISMKFTNNVSLEEV